MFTQIEALTIDAFGTILDMAPHLEPATAAFLERAGADTSTLGTPGEAARRLAHEWGTRFWQRYLAFVGSGAPFRSIRAITTDALAVVCAEFSLPGDPEEGTQIWYDRLVAQVELYPDVRGTIARLGKRYHLALVSDIDDGVVEPILERLDLPFERIFTSEGCRSYKGGADGRIFAAARAALGVPAAAIAHVGDADADVIGAGRAGMRAIWLRRPGAFDLFTEARPDAKIASFDALPALLAGKEAGAR